MEKRPLKAKLFVDFTAAGLQAHAMTRVRWPGMKPGYVPDIDEGHNGNPTAYHMGWLIDPRDPAEPVTGIPYGWEPFSP